MPLPIALQLYTVRDLLKTDYEGTLAQVARLGYRYIETGTFGPKAGATKAMLDKLGLKIAGAMTGLEPLRDQLDALLEEAKLLGYRYLTCGGVPDKMRTLEGYRESARVLAAAHRKAAAQGVSVCYHNHSFEFAKLADGSTGMDQLYANPDVHAELDVYWVKHGEQDPLAWLGKLAGRVPLLHIKDMDATPQRSFTEVGTGIVPIARLVKEAPSAGVQFLIIEQDTNWKGGPLESARVSYENLKRMAG